MGVRRLGELETIEEVRRDYEGRMLRWEREIAEAPLYSTKDLLRGCADEDQAILDGLARIARRINAEHKGEPEGAEEAG